MEALKDKTIENKIEVIYPAVPVKKIIRLRGKNITLLFVGRYFYPKGGVHVLEAFDRLTKKNKNVECVFVSEIPKKFLNRYSKNKRIKFYNLMPQNRLFREIYAKSDIFVYPGYSDTFGFAMLEAMSFGIPVVTVDGFAKKEIVEDGKTGFVIDKPKEINTHFIGSTENILINQIIKKTEKIIKDGRLHKKMSRTCIEIVKNGKFSIKERNKKLKRIYEEALV